MKRIISIFVFAALTSCADSSYQKPQNNEIEIIMAESIRRNIYIFDLEDNVRCFATGYPYAISCVQIQKVDDSSCVQSTAMEQK